MHSYNVFMNFRFQVKLKQQKIEKIKKKGKEITKTLKGTEEVGDRPVVVLKER